MKRIAVALTIPIAVFFAGCSASTPSSQSSPQPAAGSSSTPSSVGASTSPSGSSSTGATYTMADVAKHGNASDCWLVINNSVYDVTKFVPDHPGGEDILQGCGQDATAMFEAERKH